MQKLMRMFHKNEKGFTLVELMVVVVIIGILVAIAIPIYGTIQENARNRADEANVRTLRGSAAQAMAATDNTTFTWQLDGTSTDGTISAGADTDGNPDPKDYLDEWPVNPHTNTRSYVVTVTDGNIVITGDGAT